MEASHVSTPIKSNVSTIFVAIELSQRSWLVTMHCPDKDKISHHKLEGGDHAGLLTLIERMRERAARTLGAVPAGGQSEACPPSPANEVFWWARRKSAFAHPTKSPPPEQLLDIRKLQFHIGRAAVVALSG